MALRRGAFQQSPFNPNYRARQASGGGVIELERSHGIAPLAPSQPQGSGPEMGQLVKLPGANFPPAGSRGVDLTGDGNIAPGGTATLITIQVPDNQRFRIAGIGFGAGDEVALGFLTWSIKANGDSVPGYEGATAAVGSLRNLSEIFVNLGSSVVVTVTATAAATAVLTYSYIARIRGYFYMELEGAR
jgi:hypothetical protein